MKTPFKILLIITAVALLAGAALAQKRHSIVDLNTTATCAASTATNLNVVIDVPDQASVAVWVETTCGGANTANNTWAYRWRANATVTNVTLKAFSFANAGTTKQVNFTNLPTWGAGQIEIMYLTNAAGSGDITASALRYEINWSAPSQP